MLYSIDFTSTPKDTCDSCASTIAQHHVLVQTDLKKLCTPCMTKILWNSLLHSPFALFYLPATYYHIQLEYFYLSQIQSLALLKSFQGLKGACSFCTHESAKLIWFSSLRSSFDPTQGQRLGKRCIYANLYQILKEAQGSFFPSSPQNSTRSKKKKAENLVGIVEILPHSGTEFKNLQKKLKKDS
jgi:hypothetical protein